MINSEQNGKTADFICGKRRSDAGRGLHEPSSSEEGAGVYEVREIEKRIIQTGPPMKNEHWGFLPQSSF